MKTCGKGHEYTTLRCGVCRKSWNEANPGKVAAYKKAWNEENKEQIAAHKKTYHETNKKQIAAQQNEYRKANPDKVSTASKAYREANKEKVLATAKAWQKANPEKRAALKAKRRATQLQQTPPWYNHADAVAVYKELKPGYHVDHIIPLQGKNVSGLHWHHNLQILPETENMSKGNKFNPDTYIHELPLY